MYSVCQHHCPIYISNMVQSVANSILTARISGHPHAQRLPYQELALNSASVPSLFVDL